MSLLKSPVAAYARAQIALALATAAGVGGAWLFVLRPADVRLADLRQQATAVRGELDGRTDPPPSGVVAQTVALRDRLRHAPDLADPREPELFIRDLTRLCEQAGLRRLTVRSDATRRAGPLCELPVVLTFHGQLPDVTSFLRRVEQTPWLVRVKNVQIRAADGATNSGKDAGEVEARVAMKVYSSAER